MQRQLGDREVLRKRRALGTERTAHIGHLHPQLVLAQFQGGRQLAVQPVRRLVRTMHPQSAAAVGHRQKRPRLQGCRREPLLPVLALDNHRRVAKDLLVDRFTEDGAGRDVAGRLEQPGPRLGSHSRVDKRWQLLEVDGDLLGPVLSAVAVGAQHDSHRLARVSHPVVGERGPLAALGRIRWPERGHQRQRVQIGRRPRADHAVHPGTPGNVDAEHPTVRARAAHERRLQTARYHDVGDVATGPSGQPQVLAARELPRQRRIGHRISVTTL